MQHPRSSGRIAGSGAPPNWGEAPPFPTHHRCRSFLEMLFKLLFLFCWKLGEVGGKKIEFPAQRQREPGAGSLCKNIAVIFWSMRWRPNSGMANDLSSTWYPHQSRERIPLHYPNAVYRKHTCTHSSRGRELTLSRGDIYIKAARGERRLLLLLGFSVVVEDGRKSSHLTWGWRGVVPAF